MSYDWEYKYASVGHRYLKRKGWGVDQKTSQYLSGVTTICLMQRVSPSHRRYQAVDCGLWNVVPLLFNGCEKTAHFRVAFYCPQHKVYLCNDHVV
jgi:hypothetical protein